MQKAITGRQKKNNISIGVKLESIIAYHIEFVVKLLWKCCEYSITLILLNPNFCNSQVKVFNIFIRVVTID